MVDLDALRPWAADEELPSPNHGDRPSGVRGITLCVIHATADQGNERGSEEWLTSPTSKVSCHLFIRRDGSVVRMVPDEQRAWHAGKSAWLGRKNVNDFSLGWELANRNDGRETYTEAQYASVVALAAHYIKQGLQLADFVSHAAVALPVGRKTDPAGFDWIRFRLLARAALSEAPAEQAAPPVVVKPVPPPAPPEPVELPAGPLVEIVVAQPDANADGVPDGAQIPLHGPATNLPPPRPAPTPKPGWKTSEALMTLAVNLPSLMVFAGMGEASPWVRIAGVLVAGVTTLAYGQGRISAKAAPRSFFPTIRS